MVNALFQLTIAGVVGMFVAASSVFAYRFALFGLGLTLTVWLIEATSVTLAPISLSGVNIFVQDGLFTIIALAATARLVLAYMYLGQEPTPLQVLWIAFCSILLFALLQGVLFFGLQEAVVEFRPFFYFSTAVLYASTFPTDQIRLRRVTSLWLLVAVALFVLTAFRWSAEAANLAIAAQWAGVGGPGEEVRVLNASQTFFLAQASIIGLLLTMVPYSSRTWRFLPLLLLPVTFVLQHRTVWVAGIAALLLTVYWNGKLRSRLLVLLPASAIAGTVLLSILFQGNLSAIVQSLSSSTTEALSTQDSTFIWRISSWRALLTDGYIASYWDLLFGRPFGTGYARYLADFTYVTESPHSYYVQTLLRTGVLGLVVLLLAYGLTIAKLSKSLSRSQDYFSPQLIVVLLMTQLVFCVTYAPSYEQGLLFGLAMSLAYKKGALVRGPASTSSKQQRSYLGTRSA